jgi:2-polyprenyl-3-methyl-5-hydroxy-6-metoxy-1,4-benzoquinol methylase
MRVPTEKEYIHERLGSAFAEALSLYDTNRRLETLVDTFLGDELAGRQALEVGCGLGFFTERMQRFGAVVTACDIGEGLLEQTRQRTGCECHCVDALSLVEHYGESRFDVVLSSECIEHTPSPEDAVKQMIGVLKPGGLLSLSTPNILWYPIVNLATLLRVRPFAGLEHFSSWRGLRRLLTANGMTIIREKGLHLFPFQLGMHGLSTHCDEKMQFARGLMINICLLARKNR